MRKAMLTRPHSTENTRVAAVEALLSSVNPAILAPAQLSAALATATAALAGIPAPSAAVRRALYTHLTKLFDRIGTSEKGAGVDFDADDLRKVLFGRDVGIEALRLLRADAVIAACRACGGVSEQIAGDVEAAMKDEISPVVRERLAGVPR